MKEGNNNLMNGIDRLSKLVAHVQSLKGRVSIMERDLLLQELRELYMTVLSLEVSDEGCAVSDAEPVETDEVVAFENIMQDMQGGNVSGEADVEKGMAAVDAAPVMDAPKAVGEEVKGDMVEEAVKDEADSPFAPAEPEPEVIPAPEPVMERIEGNQYEELFEPSKVVDMDAPVAEVDHHEEKPVEHHHEEKPVEHHEVKAMEHHEEKAVEHHEEKAVEHHEVKAVEHHEVKKHQAQPEQPSLFDYLSQSVTTVAESKPAPTTLADKFGVNRATLESQLEQKVNRHKVSDLRTVININDKFSFMTELFHNNMKAYNDFILKLNAISDAEEALKCVKEVSDLNDWDEHSLSVTTFYKVLERKFEF